MMNAAWNDCWVNGALNASAPPFWTSCAKQVNRQILIGGMVAKCATRVRSAATMLIAAEGFELLDQRCCETYTAKDQKVGDECTTLTEFWIFEPRRGHANIGAQHKMDVRGVLRKFKHV